MFIVKKTINGKDYYYLRKSERKDGKVRAVTVAYLGKTKKEAERKKKEIGQKLSEKLRDDKVIKVKIGSKEMDVKLKDNANKNDKIETKEEKEFVSFVQEAGLIWGPEPEIYGGVAGFYTYGPLGKLLKNKVEESVRGVFNANGFREIEGPTVLPDIVWKASGHLETFADPIIWTKDGKEQYRADKLLEDNGVKVESLEMGYLKEMFKKHNIKAPSGKELSGEVEMGSLMMKTGVAGQSASLRPETATVTYLPFPRLLNYFRKKVPFGVFQIGKAYRNEISPRQGVLRGREFTQAEGQIFVDPQEKNNWEKFDEVKDEKLPFWSSDSQKKDAGWGEVSLGDALKKKLVKSQAYGWCLWLAYQQFINFGVPKERIRLRQHHPNEKAFYADDAWDIELNLKNYGWFEVCGVHDRTAYDLTQHSKESGEKLEAVRDNGEKFVPHVLEIAFGTDRPTYALMDLFFDKREEGEGKTMFKIPYRMAPIDVSIFPLMKKPELLKLSEDVKELLEKDFVVDYDVSGSIGRRYLRSASAGTPFAITIDYESLEKKDCTVRDRDTEKQVRVKISELRGMLRGLLGGEIMFGNVGKVVKK